jgi:hypothetical protein
VYIRIYSGIVYMRRHYAGTRQLVDGTSILVDAYSKTRGHEVGLTIHDRRQRSPLPLGVVSAPVLDPTGE